MTKMGRPRKPTALRVYEGNLGKRPLNEAEPMPSRAMPDMPDYVRASPYAAAQWKSLAPHLHEIGILTLIDGTVFAAYCLCYARWRHAEEDLARVAANDPTTHGVLMRTSSGNAVQNPLVGAANTCRRDMLRAGAELGLSPVSRALLRVDGEERDEISRKFNL